MHQQESSPRSWRRFLAIDTQTVLEPAFDRAPERPLPICHLRPGGRAERRGLAKHDLSKATDSVRHGHKGVLADSKAKVSDNRRPGRKESVVASHPSVEERWPGYVQDQY